MNELARVSLEGTGVTRTIPDGRALVLVIEDEISAQQRQEAHALVGRRVDDPGLHFDLVAVAEVGRFAFWPARKFVLAAVRKTEALESTTVWLDWSDALATGLALRRGETAFVVVDATGVIMFQAQGLLDEAQRAALDAAIAAL